MIPYFVPGTRRTHPILKLRNQKSERKKNLRPEAGKSVIFVLSCTNKYLEIVECFVELLLWNYRSFLWNSPVCLKGGMERLA